MLFKYEWCSHPPALFDKSSLPRVANKPALADEIWDLVKYEKTVLPTNVHHVIDDRALLQRMPWPCGYTVAAICKLYADYVNQRYQHCTIVFDGYEEGSTVKAPTHQRRSGGSVGPVANFTFQTVMKLKKDLFLTRTVNRQKFINVLHDALKRIDCTILHAKGDADVLIVETTVESAKTADTILVMDDTDLLILLCYYADVHSKGLYLKPEPRQRTKTPRIWDIMKQECIK